MQPFSPDMPLELALDLHGWHYRVPLGREPLLLGRSAECTVAIPDPDVSRRHCRILPDGHGGWLVEDLGSTAGTVLEGQPLGAGPVPLAPGARLVIGGTTASVRPRTGDSERGVRHLDIVLRSVGDLYGSEDLGALLRTIVDRTLSVAGGERGALLLAAPGRGLEVVVARTSEGLDLPLDQSLTRSLPERALRTQTPVVLTDTEAPGQRTDTPQSVFRGGLRTVLCVPLPGPGSPLGVLYVDGRRPAEDFGPDELAVFEALAVHGAVAIERSRLRQEQVRRELEEKQRLKSENAALRARLGAGAPIGQSPAMIHALALASRVAPSDATVCLLGETGTGKEVLARHVHGQSGRAKGPFVVVDCGSIPESLIESELFGHKKGAFTGAGDSRPGRFREAGGGTVFLDEIGELPLAMQPRLLRVLQEKTVQPLGASERLPVDARIVCATHRDLGKMVAEGRFREDLYYRLAVFTVPIPPLRERGEDVLLLAEHFLERYAAMFRTALSGFTRAASEALLAHPWPGNVRELENRVQRAVLLASPPFVGQAELGLGPGDAASESERLPGLQEARAAADARFERAYVEDVLRRTGGNVSRAAEQAGVSRQLLTRLISRHQIDRLRFVSQRLASDD
jgi:Nif-specific regulatory protein